MAHLTCDPYPKTVTQPTEFELYIDGATTPVKSPVQVNADGSVQMEYDLSSLAAGAHSIVVKAAIEDVWGVSESPADPPFTFTKRDLTTAPSAPSNIKLSAS
jgi:hypothetical protein